MLTKEQRRRQRKLEKFFSALGVVLVAMMLLGTITFAAVAGDNTVYEREPVREARQAVVPVSTLSTDRHIQFTAGEENGDIDYSTAAEGYVMVRCECNRAAKFIVEKDGKTVQHDLPADGEYYPYPLTMGDGAYSVRISLWEVANRYSKMAIAEFEAVITDEFTRFLLPTVLAPFSQEPEYMEMAREMYTVTASDKEFADSVYRYIMQTIHYDKDLLPESGMGYQTDAGRALDEGRGICTDFSSAFAMMMRSCRIPCKIIYGDIQTADGPRYHAWNMVWLEDDSGGAWWRYDATQEAGPVKEGAIDNIYLNFKPIYGEPIEIH